CWRWWGRAVSVTSSVRTRWARSGGSSRTWSGASAAADPRVGRSAMDRGRRAMAPAAARPYDRVPAESAIKGGAIRMASPAEIVEQYFDAWTSKDFETARHLLHDDLSF